jgi:large subunit ribosomal protein L28
MAKKCEICGKGPWFGKQVTFSHKRSSKKWSANIQTVKVADSTNTKKVKSLYILLEGWKSYKSLNGSRCSKILRSKFR